VAFDIIVFRKSGRDNLFKCTYVLPDGITYTKGFVKDMEEACRYRALYDGAPDLLSRKEGRDQSEDRDKVEGRKRIDLTKNVCEYWFPCFLRTVILCCIVFVLAVLLCEIYFAAAGV